MPRRFPEDRRVLRSTAADTPSTTTTTYSASFRRRSGGTTMLWLNLSSPNLRDLSIYGPVTRVRYTRNVDRRSPAASREQLNSTIAMPGAAVCLQRRKCARRPTAANQRRPTAGHVTTPAPWRTLVRATIAQFPPSSLATPCGISCDRATYENIFR